MLVKPMTPKQVKACPETLKAIKEIAEFNKQGIEILGLPIIMVNQPIHKLIKHHTSLKPKWLN